MTMKFTTGEHPFDLFEDAWLEFPSSDTPTQDEGAYPNARSDTQALSAGAAAQGGNDKPSSNDASSVTDVGTIPANGSGVQDFADPQSDPVAGPGGATAAVALSGNQDIDGNLALVRWNVADLTYSFPASGADYGANYPGNANNESFGQLSLHHRKVFNDALNANGVLDSNGGGGGLWMSVEGFTNQTISSFAPTGNVMLRGAYSTDPASAYAYYPDRNDNNSHNGGDSWYRLATSYS